MGERAPVASTTVAAALIVLAQEQIPSELYVNLGSVSQRDREQRQEKRRLDRQVWKQERRLQHGRPR